MFIFAVFIIFFEGLPKICAPQLGKVPNISGATAFDHEGGGHTFGLESRMQVLTSKNEAPPSPMTH